jgi:hypothetical protein
MFRRPNGRLSLRLSGRIIQGIGSIISGKNTSYNKNSMDYADQSRPVMTLGYGSFADRGPKLLDRVREAIRMLHYRIRSEDGYVQWIKRFIVFHGKQHPFLAVVCSNRQ